MLRFFLINGVEVKTSNSDNKKSLFPFVFKNEIPALERELYLSAVRDTFTKGIKDKPPTDKCQILPPPRLALVHTGQKDGN